MKEKEKSEPQQLPSRYHKAMVTQLAAGQSLADGRSQDSDEPDTADDGASSVLACLDDGGAQHALLGVWLLDLALLGLWLGGDSCSCDCVCGSICNVRGLDDLAARGGLGNGDRLVRSRDLRCLALLAIAFLEDPTVCLVQCGQACRIRVCRGTEGRAQQWRAS